MHITTSVFFPPHICWIFVWDLSSPHARCCCEWNAPRQRSMEGNLPTSQIHGSSRHVDLERCRFWVDFGADSGRWKGALTKILWKFVWRLDLKTLYATFWMPNRFLMIQHKDILFEHDLQHSWDSWEVLWAIWPSEKEVCHCIHEERRIQNKVNLSGRLRWKCLVADSGVFAFWTFVESYKVASLVGEEKLQRPCTVHPTIWHFKVPFLHVFSSLCNLRKR